MIQTLLVTGAILFCFLFRGCKEIHGTGEETRGYAKVQAETRDLETLISKAYLDRTLRTFDSSPTWDNLEEVFRASYPGQTITLGKYEYYDSKGNEVRILMINGVPFQLQKVVDTMREPAGYVARLSSKDDSLRLPILRGMLVLGRALEAHEYLEVILAGMLIEEKALPLLAQWARLRGDAAIQEAVDIERTNYADRFERLKEKPLEEFKHPPL